MAQVTASAPGAHPARGDAGTRSPARRSRPRWASTPLTGLSTAEAAARLEQYGPEQVRRGEAGAALARVRAPVRRPDADRAARRGDRQHRPAQAVRDRDRAPAADARQRRARPAPGGQGGRGGRGAAEDDDRQGEGAPRRRARRRFRPRSSSPATSSRSRPATSCPPTAACSRRRRSRSPRRR